MAMPKIVQLVGLVAGETEYVTLRRCCPTPHLDGGLYGSRCLGRPRGPVAQFRPWNTGRY